MLIALSPTIMVDLLDHDSAIIALKNPALISMPLAFASGILVSLLRPEPDAAARSRRRSGGSSSATPPLRGPQAYRHARAEAALGASASAGAPTCGTRRGKKLA